MMPAILLYHEDLAKVRSVMSNEEFGTFVGALDDYAYDGVEPQGLPPIVQLAFSMIAPKLEKAAKRYSAKVENGKKGGRPAEQEPNNNQTETEQEPNETESKPNETEQEPEAGKTKTVNLKPKNVNLNPTPEGVGGAGGDASADAPAHRERFVPPTREEADQYAQEKGLKVDVERFLAYYESNGWKVGKNPMKSWRAAMVNWSKNDFRGRDAPKTVNATRFQQREYSDTDMASTSTEIFREAMALGVNESGGAS